MQFEINKFNEEGFAGPCEFLNIKGSFVSKIFMGSTFNEIVALGKKSFNEVNIFKPLSSRKDSKENFIICRNLR